MPVINATGVILHTNLGRAPLPERAARAAARAARNYADLEVDRETGRRGKRGRHAELLLTALTGAEAALVVNNCAAALLLAMAALAKGKQVLVSRGELIEIGGEFRIPDILAASGARLVEVGTTNRTRIGDYRAAVEGQDRAILKVHPSNYRVVGFTADAVGGRSGRARPQARGPVPVRRRVRPAGPPTTASRRRAQRSPTRSPRAPTSSRSAATSSSAGRRPAASSGAPTSSTGCAATRSRGPSASDKIQMAALEQVLATLRRRRGGEIPVHRMLHEPPETLRSARPGPVRDDRRRARRRARRALRVGRSAVVDAGPRARPRGAFGSRFPTRRPSRPGCASGTPAVFSRRRGRFVLLDCRTVTDEQVPHLARAVHYALEGDEEHGHDLHGDDRQRVRADADARPRPRRVDDGAPRRRHRRPRRPRQVLADRPAHRHGPGPVGRGEAPGPHDRPRLRVDRAPVRARGRVRRRARATSGSSATCSPASGPSGWSCSWSPPTRDGSRSRRSTSQILDVLGVAGGVVALTKRDLVDEDDPRPRGGRGPRTGRRHRPRRLPASSAVSAETGEGLDDLRTALDAMLAERAGTARRRGPGCSSTGCSRISGAGTVVTGTLGGDCLAVGDEVELYPPGRTARIRSLQTHKRNEDRADPVSRVAANLVGHRQAGPRAGRRAGRPRRLAADDRLRRIARARSAASPTRSPARGAFKVYAGAAEADATTPDLRRYPARGGTGSLRPDHDDSPVGAGRLRSLRPARIRPAGDASAAARCWIRRRRGAPDPLPRPPRPARRGDARRPPGDPRRRARRRPGRRTRSRSPARRAGVPQAGEWLLRDGLLAMRPAPRSPPTSMRSTRRTPVGGRGAARRRLVARSPTRAATPPPDARANAGLVDAVLDRLAADGRRHRARAPRSRSPRIDPPTGRAIRSSSVWSRRSASEPAPAADRQGARVAGHRSRRDRRGRQGRPRRARRPRPRVHPGAHRAGRGVVAAAGERRHHGERVPRGPRDQPEVRRADPGVVRPDGASRAGKATCGSPRSDPPPVPDPRSRDPASRPSRTTRRPRPSR